MEVRLATAPSSSLATQIREGTGDPETGAPCEYTNAYSSKATLGPENVKTREHVFGNLYKGVCSPLLGKLDTTRSW